MIRAARALVTERLAREVQEHRLEVGLVHVDGADGDAGAGGLREQLGQHVAGVVDDQLDRRRRCTLAA